MKHWAMQACRVALMSIVDKGMGVATLGEPRMPGH